MKWVKSFVFVDQKGGGIKFRNSIFCSELTFKVL